MSTRATPFALNFDDVPHGAAATPPAPEPEAAAGSPGQPATVRVGHRAFEVRPVTVAVKQVDRVVRRLPIAPPTPIPIAPRRLLGSRPEPDLEGSSRPESWSGPE